MESLPGLRPRVNGKFLFVGDEKFYVRGVTYGPFRTGAEGGEYGHPAAVRRDFSQMAAAGINAVRVYTVPPRWFLDLAQEFGLRVMVGLPWEQHITFLDERQRAQAIEAKVRAGVRACAGHPAVLCYAIGNEIPVSIVRWHGRRRVERFLKKLYRSAKAEDPEGLFTYVNFPTTEYLQLSFLDFVCFNVYLEEPERFGAYLARLQNLAGDRPLLMAEIGLDSRRHGAEAQARSLQWQIQSTFASGSAGCFVFAWTDEWHRGGVDIEDWDFGLTDRERKPKQALEAVQKAFAEVPIPRNRAWPKISVVVCTYNGARTIRRCCEALLNLDYPDFEVIIVNDGSTDETPDIITPYGFGVISTENRGLSQARNTGFEAAQGEVVAYLDDDAYPDPQWLIYLAMTFSSTPHAGVGGPNIPPPGDGPIAECVAQAPGGPLHVLLSDTEAEHIPGCNMAFRKSALQKTGGFDPQFRTAGDDVDLCWRLQEQGGTLGFSPAAMVWHHRRNSVKTYWKQQRGYGKAEALLERKWPRKYNALGHLTWFGRIYGKGLLQPLGLGRQRIYHGTWGLAPFQSLYERIPGRLASCPLMPEWYLLIGILATLSGLGIFWKPMRLALPLLVLAIGISLTQAALGGLRAIFPGRSWKERLKLKGLTALLHLLQPMARLWGRLSEGLTPWRRPGAFGVPRPRVRTEWSETWASPFQRLESLEEGLKSHGAIMRRGGPSDPWDLELEGGPLSAARLRMTVEEHGAGRQQVRVRIWPRYSPMGIGGFVLFALLTIGAARDQAWIACAALGSIALLVASHMWFQSAHAIRTALRVMDFRNE